MTLADVAPTVMRALGRADGRRRRHRSVAGAFVRARRCRSAELYAESFAPLVEFGWAPLRAVRSGAWKLIAAPKPELFDVETDPGEQTNAIAVAAATSRGASTRASTATRPTR